MDGDRVAGDWKEVKGKVKASLGELTGNDRAVAEGRAEQLVGRLQKRFGVAKDAAREKYEGWKHAHDLRAGRAKA